MNIKINKINARRSFVEKVLFNLFSTSLILVTCNNNKEVVENVVERKAPAKTVKKQINDKKEAKINKEIEVKDVFIKYEV